MDNDTGRYFLIGTYHSTRDENGLAMRNLCADQKGFDYYGIVNRYLDWIYYITNFYNLSNSHLLMVSLLSYL